MQEKALTLARLGTGRPAARAYEEHRQHLLAVLGHRFPWLDAAERESALQEAYVVLLSKDRAGSVDLASMKPHEVRAFLVRTAIHKAFDEGKRAERQRTEPIGVRALTEPDRGAAPDEVAEVGVESDRVREIIAELPARRQAVVTLRFFFERTPEEIQRQLGITARTYRRELERAMRHIADGYELVRSGRYCESRRSMVLALVADVARPDRARQARRHLASCPGCRRWAAELREATRRGAALLPLPPLAAENGQLASVVEAAGSVRDAVFDALASARDRILDAASAAQQHVAGLATRLDPGSAGYAATLRPAPALAAVLGCVAIGGGATYCAIDGLPSLFRPVVEGEVDEVRKAADKRPRARAHKVAPVSAEPAPAPRPEPEPAEREQPAKAETPAPDPTPEDTAATSVPAAEAAPDFDIESAPAPVVPAAPAPSGSGGSGTQGGSEFGL